MSQNYPSGRYTCLDIEMTGLDSKIDRIVEIAAWEMIDDKITGNKIHYIVNPEMVIPDETIKIHGIDNQKIIGKPLFRDIAHDVVNFLSKDPIVIHCVEYSTKKIGKFPFVADIAFLNKELSLCGKKRIRQTQFVNQKDWLERLYKHVSLDEALDQFGVDRNKRNEDGHSALLDAFLLAQVFPDVRDHWYAQESTVKSAYSSQSKNKESGNGFFDHIKLG